jgi:hypothetical protein
MIVRLKRNIFLGITNIRKSTEIKKVKSTVPNWEIKLSQSSHFLTTCQQLPVDYKKFNLHYVQVRLGRESEQSIFTNMGHMVTPLVFIVVVHISDAYFSEDSLRQQWNALTFLIQLQRIEVTIV